MGISITWELIFKNANAQDPPPTYGIKRSKGRAQERVLSSQVMLVHIRAYCDGSSGPTPQHELTSWQMDSLSLEQRDSNLYQQKVNAQGCSGLGKRWDLREIEPCWWCRPLNTMWFLLAFTMVGNLAFGFWVWKQAHFKSSISLHWNSFSTQDIYSLSD